MNMNENLTGRVFMCITDFKREGVYEDSLIFSFEVGGLYAEMKTDIDNENLTTDEDLLIATHEGLPLYVEKKDFALLIDTSSFFNKMINNV